MENDSRSLDTTGIQVFENPSGSTSPEIPKHIQGTVPVSPRGLSRGRASCVLAFICTGFLLQGANYTHMTSFFNVYALEEKDLSSAQYGVIMGANCFVMIFVSPVTAKLVDLRYFKDKNIMFVAWTIDAVFCFLFSFAYKLGPGYPFFFGSLTLRILEAFGTAVGFVMPYVITGLELNEINHIIIPVLETIYGLAVVAGPAISGILFDLGGFPLPFRVLGGALMTLMFLGICFFPEPDERSDVEEKTSGGGSLRRVLKFPVVVNVLCTVSSFVLLSFNESTLALRLNSKFGMSATECGLLFLYAGGLYAFSSLFLGYISRRISDPRHLVLPCQVIILFALLLQGPLIPVEQTRGVVILAQMLLGLGAGPAFVCSYLHSLRYISNGDESKETHAALGAIFTPATAIGGTIGPLVANVLLDYWSYETAVAVSAVQTLLVTALLAFATFHSTGSARRN
ncbi:MFS-type transporter SLC18B1-like [Galendromus occidentalis]|uniref:MFS-type transporter SLC18B1-like n=1 Tax=Galendromus occidentalis TaxID=34638 RepID=A0AAJ6QTF0_9ACAR|nr:MFS-type transporter SLC18B1-like [Galendromus occidentalis]